MIKIIKIDRKIKCVVTRAAQGFLATEELKSNANMKQINQCRSGVEKREKICNSLKFDQGNSQLIYFVN